MPKTYSQHREYYKTISENMRLLQGGRTDGEMANIIGKKSPAVWVSRKKSPEGLSLDEVQRLCSKMHIDPIRFLTNELQIG